ncbi:hypothetical protein [Undibacterium oligocarboniphilum]|uniref:Lipoprotein n=1 Tax=Undibacterium oligocarboniphilum TaxID=666702 RepID=A0A850QRX0_9BURK|nr:hypothetical protein [Undibacterium oligocarboniphilum]MBC3871687.1 hypothetical protein [Undibacterium oligocarboniphilum]NVO79124.1 hypothetical protein [Undibacterium oligocarboniphilum]
MKPYLILLILCALSACSTIDKPSPNGSKTVLDDGDYVTGSNLPQRGKRIQTLTPEQVEDMKRGVTQQGRGN